MNLQSLPRNSGTNLSLPTSSVLGHHHGKHLSRFLHWKCALAFVVFAGFAVLIAANVGLLVAISKSEDRYRQLYEKINALERSYNSTQTVHGGGPDLNNRQDTYDQPDSENFTTLFNNIKEINSSLHNHISSRLEVIRIELHDQLNRSREEIIGRIETESTGVRADFHTNITHLRATLTLRCLKLGGMSIPVFQVFENTSIPKLQ